jgi:chaperonin GroES
MQDYKAVLESLEVSISPIGDRVAVLPDEEETVSAGGLVIPDTTEKDAKQIGTVIAVGMGNIGENHIDPWKYFKVGDRVCFGKYVGDDLSLRSVGGTEVKVKILRVDAVLCFCDPK